VWAGFSLGAYPYASDRVKLSAVCETWRHSVAAARAISRAVMVAPIDCLFRHARLDFQLVIAIRSLVDGRVRRTKSRVPRSN
jgi:hypothetical protein